MNTTSEYFLADALGSVRQMTDPTSEITFTQSYDPYGVVTFTSGESHTDYGFTGESYDSYIKLMYLRARYYNPYLNHFTQPDTIVPSTINQDDVTNIQMLHYTFYTMFPFSKLY